jgi:hypothetical protein
MSPLTLCTWMRDAQVGQEGIGKTHQMQVCNCRPYERFWYWPSPNSCLASFTDRSTAQRQSYAWMSPAAESSGASVTSPRIFRDLPLREITTCSGLRVLPPSQPASTKW